jgi:hypothetical protein
LINDSSLFCIEYGHKPIYHKSAHNSDKKNDNSVIFHTVDCFDELVEGNKELTAHGVGGGIQDKNKTQMEEYDAQKYVDEVESFCNWWYVHAIVVC